LDGVRRNYGVSLAGTLLMDEPYNPRLLELFRERMVTPQRRIVAKTIRDGIDRGEIRPDVDVERVLDLVLGAFFAAVFAKGRPGPDWPEATVMRCGRRWPRARRGGADEVGYAGRSIARVAEQARAARPAIYRR
jgi:hypothetical protein